MTLFLADVLGGSYTPESPHLNIRDSSVVSLCKLHNNDIYIGVEIEIECGNVLLSDLAVPNLKLDDAIKLCEAYNLGKEMAILLCLVNI